MRSDVSQGLEAAPGKRPARPRRAAGAFSGYAALSLGAGAAVLVLVVLPLLAQLAQAVLPDLFGARASLAPSLAGLASLAQDPYMLASGANSLLLSAATALLATALGVATAYLLVLTDMPGRGLMWGIVRLVLISPSFLIARLGDPARRGRADPQPARRCPHECPALASRRRRRAQPQALP